MNCSFQGTELPDACTEPNDNVQKSFSAVAHALSTNLQVHYQCNFLYVDHFNYQSVFF